MWDECLSIIKDNISPEQYDAWFKPITSVSYKDHVLRLMVPTRFFAEQLEERYMKIFGSYTISHIWPRRAAVLRLLPDWLRPGHTYHTTGFKRKPGRETWQQESLSKQHSKRFRFTTKPQIHI